MTLPTSAQELGLFGRGPDIERIVENCLGERMTVLTAEPGTGLTSLLLAGVAPELVRHGFITVYFRDWEGRFFLTSLKETIATAVREQADPGFFGEVEMLHEMLARVRFRTGVKVALLLDDFQDYLTAHHDTDLANSCDAEISNVLAGREGLTVLALHDSAVPRLERLCQYVPNLMGNQYALPLLRGDDARQMATAKAEAAGLDFEESCLEELLADPSVKKPGGYHPFPLTAALESLCGREHRLKSKAIRSATLAKGGGASRLVNESMDAKMNDLGSTHKELFFRWCTLLITESKTRANVPEKQLIEHSGSMNRFALTLFPRLAQTQILSPFDVNGTMCYRIAREPLVAIIRDWWERREAAIIARRRAIFRITSISVAVGAIVLAYFIFLLVPTPK